MVYAWIEKDQVLAHATSMMNLENIMQIEKNRVQRPHTIWFYLYAIPRIEKSMEKKKNICLSEDGARAGNKI